MKLITPEISWHQKEPIFSVHFSPQTWKLATGGADSTVKIWLVKEKEDGDNSIGIEFLSNLDRHAKPVNVVRFSPNGSLLASAGDDGTIILWKLNENEKTASNTEFADDDILNKESWLVHKMLRGHIEDVYDLAWSPSNNQLISGSVDNSAIVWDIEKGQIQKVISDHKHYVQGVCWDPRNFYLATHSSDRTCRLYATSNHKCLYNIQRNTMSYEKDGKLVKTKYSRMFMDETMQSFFRRCTFSPDGSFLFLPAGLCDGSDKPGKTTYVFARGQFKRPICHLPGGKKATVCVNCSPVVYELLDDKENQYPSRNENKHFEVPYRMVYAVASLDSITIYDTQHKFPIGYCANIHYASLTDMTWSSDGKLLVVSSTDGYCSFIKFEEEELGKPIEYDPIQFQIAQAKIRKKTKKDVRKKEAKKSDTEKGNDKNVGAENVPTPVINENKEKEKSALKSIDNKQPTIEKLFITPIRKRKRTTDGSPNGASNIKQDLSDKEKSKSDVLSPVVNKMSAQKPPKRVQVITLSSGSNEASSSVSQVNPHRVVPVGTEKAESNPSICGNKVSKPNSEHLANASLNIHKPVSNNNEKHPQNPLTSPNKTPKRVTVTTLSSNNSEKPSLNQLISPNKMPKRVNVTTLVTFPNNAPKTDQALLSPVHAPSGLSNKSVTPSKSVCTAAISPISPVVNTERIVQKQPKRITVQTLSTFTDVQKTVELEEEESPISNIPVQVDPPQLDDMLSTNSFDASLIETTLNNSNSEKNSECTDINSLNTSGSGASKSECILID